VGRACVNVVLICGAIKRVEGSRWAASIRSASANELARFTVSTQRQQRQDTKCNDHHQIECFDRTADGPQFNAMSDETME